MLGEFKRSLLSNSLEAKQILFFHRFNAVRKRGKAVAEMNVFNGYPLVINSEVIMSKIPKCTNAKLDQPVRFA